MSQRQPLLRERYGLACWTGSARAMESAHAHDEVELNLSAAGPLHYLIGGRVQTLPAGRLGLFWASTPHQLIGVDPDASLIWMTIPLTTFLSWKLPGPLLGALFRNEIVSAAGPRSQDHDHDHDHRPPGRPVADHEADADPGPVRDEELDRAVMLRWAEEIGRSPAHSEIVELEARAALYRLALRLAPAGDDHDHPGPARFAGTPVAAMTGFLSRSFREPIQVADVAAAAHLSPQHAMELFHRTIGLTIGGYLLQCRIAEAQRLLVTTDAPVTRIALESGFGSLSRFHAAFKAATRTTPARYRRTTPPPTRH
ncbi:helix-turn-helix domain-containing protein [Microlunatus speluncae]|uniref:helix-turn-helix domain-containing protein n=1 Tax=Microlunatus speluncae TaxID=2594267 RepID=UPI001266268E|nr:helix-turn-helix domain-containing protein [Microlunatus speluncae]